MAFDFYFKHTEILFSPFGIESDKTSRQIVKISWLEYQTVALENQILISKEKIISTHCRKTQNKYLIFLMFCIKILCSIYEVHVTKDHLTGLKLLKAIFVVKF